MAWRIHGVSHHHSLILSGVDVSMLSYKEATVAHVCHRLCCQHVWNLVANANVIFGHIDKNDFLDKRQPPRPPRNTAWDIVNLALELIHVHSAGVVIIDQLARFLVHQSNWCIQVNEHLIQLIPQVARRYNIHLWRQSWGLSNQQSWCSVKIMYMLTM